MNGWGESLPELGQPTRVLDFPLAISATHVHTVRGMRSTMGKPGRNLSL